MKFKLIPYKSIGKLLLGMNSTQISKVLNINPTLFEKSEGVFVDDFEIMHVYYKNDKSVAFEVFSDVEIIFNDINLSKNIINKLTQEFKNLDDNLEIDCYGFTSYKYGFAIYGESDVVESVFIFEKDYYEYIDL